MRYISRIKPKIGVSEYRAALLQAEMWGPGSFQLWLHHLSLRTLKFSVPLCIEPAEGQRTWKIVCQRFFGGYAHHHMLLTRNLSCGHM